MPPQSVPRCAAPRARARRPWAALGWGAGVGAALLCTAAVGVLGFVTPGWFLRDVLDAVAIEHGVRQIVVGSYQVDGVRAVTCPDGQPVLPDHSFTCRVQVDEDERQVTITVKDTEGIYEVSRPR